jgi:hypothetical protein
MGADIKGRLHLAAKLILDLVGLRCKKDVVLWLLRAFTSGPVKTGRRACSFVCIALALAQVLAFVHEGVVPHVVCAEHGESMHAGQPSHATAVHQPAVASASWLRVESSADSVRHGHDHCACMAQRRERFALPAVAALAFGFETSRAQRPFAREDRFVAGVDTIRVAPKGSPPV